MRRGLGDRIRLNELLLEGFYRVPHRTFLYCLGTDGIWISDNVAETGLLSEHFGRDRSSRPYIPLSLADAWIAASALEANAILVQKGPEFDAVPVAQEPLPYKRAR